MSRGKPFLQGLKFDYPFLNGYSAPYRLLHKFQQLNQFDQNPYHHLCHTMHSPFKNTYVLVKPTHNMKDMRTEAKAIPSTACTTTTGTT